MRNPPGFVSRFRKFAGSFFELQPRPDAPKVGQFGSRKWSETYPWFVRSEIEKAADTRRKKGKKVRIVSSRSVKKYGGDIAYFLYEKEK